MTQSSINKRAIYVAPYYLIFHIIDNCKRLNRNNENTISFKIFSIVLKGRRR